MSSCLCQDPFWKMVAVSQLKLDFLCVWWAEVLGKKNINSLSKYRSIVSTLALLSSPAKKLPSHIVIHYHMQTIHHEDNDGDDEVTERRWQMNDRRVNSEESCETKYTNEFSMRRNIVASTWGRTMFSRQCTQDKKHLRPTILVSQSRLHPLRMQEQTLYTFGSNLEVLKKERREREKRRRISWESKSMRRSLTVFSKLQCI